MGVLDWVIWQGWARGSKWSSGDATWVTMHVGVGRHQRVHHHPLLDRSWFPKAKVIPEETQWSLNGTNHLKILLWGTLCGWGITYPCYGEEKWSLFFVWEARKSILRSGAERLWTMTLSMDWHQAKPLWYDWVMSSAVKKKSPAKVFAKVGEGRVFWELKVRCCGQWVSQ